MIGKFSFAFLVLLFASLVIADNNIQLGNIPALYEPILIGTSSRIIHVARVLSDFDNSWGGRSNLNFTIDSIPLGSLHQVNSDGTMGSTINAGDLVNNVNNELLVWYNTPAGTAEQTVVIEMSVSDGTNSQICNLVVMMYDNCASLQSLGDGLLNQILPLAPSFQIQWLTGAQNFKFDVTSPYLAGSYLTLLHFGDTQIPSNYNLTNSYHNPVCSNHDASAKIHLMDQLAAAPSASYPNALDGTFAAYDNKADWSLDDVSCSSIIQSLQKSLTGLLGCRDFNPSAVGNRAISSSVNSTSGTIDYQGQLHLTYIRPIDVYNEAAGWSTIDHTQRFAFHFQQHLEALVGLSSSPQLRAYVRKAEVDLAGALQVTLETQYPNEGLGAANNVVKASDSSATSFVVDSSQGPCTNAPSVCVQSYEYSHGGWADANNGVAYRFSWPIVRDNSQSVSVDITFSSKLYTLTDLGNVMGSVDVNVYENISLAQADSSNHLTSSDIVDPHVRMAIRCDLNVNVEDRNNFDLDIDQVQLCYSSLEGYDIDVNKGGCDDAMIQASEKYLLVNQKAPNSVGAASEFATQYIAKNTLLMQDNSNAGLASNAISFSPMPLSRQSDRIYSAHVKMTVNQVALSKKRVIRHQVILRPHAGQDEANAISGSQDGLAQFRVAAASLEDLVDPLLNNAGATNAVKTQSTSRSLLPTVLGSIGVFAGVALVAIGVAAGSFFVISRRRQALQHQQLAVELDVSDI